MFLVALDLALQLVDQGLHPLVVLLVLVPSESKLLDGSLGLAEVLQDVIVAPGLGVQLALQLPDASLLNYPSGGEPGHPGLQARPVTSPRAIGHRQMVLMMLMMMIVVMIMMIMVMTMMMMIMMMMTMLFMMMMM